MTEIAKGHILNGDYESLTAEDINIIVDQYNDLFVTMGIVVGGTPREMVKEVMKKLRGSKGYKSSPNVGSGVVKFNVDTTSNYVLKNNDIFSFLLNISSVGNLGVAGTAISINGVIWTVLVGTIDYLVDDSVLVLKVLDTSIKTLEVVMQGTKPDLALDYSIIAKTDLGSVGGMRAYQNLFIANSTTNITKELNVKIYIPLTEYNNSSDSNPTNIVFDVIEVGEIDLHIYSSDSTEIKVVSRRQDGYFVVNASLDINDIIVSGVDYKELTVYINQKGYNYNNIGGNYSDFNDGIKYYVTNFVSNVNIRAIRPILGFSGTVISKVGMSSSSNVLELTNEPKFSGYMHDKNSIMEVQKLGSLGYLPKYESKFSRDGTDGVFTYEGTNYGNTLVKLEIKETSTGFKVRMSGDNVVDTGFQDMSSKGIEKLCKIYVDPNIENLTFTAINSSHVKPVMLNYHEVKDYINQADNFRQHALLVYNSLSTSTRYLYKSNGVIQVPTNKVKLPVITPTAYSSQHGGFNSNRSLSKGTVEGVFASATEDLPASYVNGGLTGNPISAAPVESLYSLNPSLNMSNISGDASYIYHKVKLPIKTATEETVLDDNMTDSNNYVELTSKFNKVTNYSIMRFGLRDITQVRDVNASSTADRNTYNTSYNFVTSNNHLLSRKFKDGNPSNTIQRYTLMPFYNTRDNSHFSPLDNLLLPKMSISTTYNSTNGTRAGFIGRRFIGNTSLTRYSNIKFLGNDSPINLNHTISYVAEDVRIMPILNPFVPLSNTTAKYDSGHIVYGPRNLEISYSGLFSSTSPVPISTNPIDSKRLGNSNQLISGETLLDVHMSMPVLKGDMYTQPIDMVVGRHIIALTKDSSNRVWIRVFGTGENLYEHNVTAPAAGAAAPAVPAVPTVSGSMYNTTKINGVRHLATEINSLVPFKVDSEDPEFKITTHCNSSLFNTTGEGGAYMSAAYNSCVISIAWTNINTSQKSVVYFGTEVNEAGNIVRIGNGSKDMFSNLTDRSSSTAFNQKLTPLTVGKDQIRYDVNYRPLLIINDGELKAMYYDKGGIGENRGMFYKILGLPPIRRIIQGSSLDYPDMVTDGLVVESYNGRFFLLSPLFTRRPCYESNTFTNCDNAIDWIEIKPPSGAKIAKLEYSVTATNAFEAEVTIAMLGYHGDAYVSKSSLLKPRTIAIAKIDNR